VLAVIPDRIGCGTPPKKNYLTRTFSLQKVVLEIVPPPIIIKASSHQN